MPSPTHTPELLARKRLLDSANQRKRRLQRDLAGGGRPRPQLCEVCGCQSGDGRSLHLDHDHATGLFRGWLCNHCNLALGHAMDDPGRLRLLAEYLELSGPGPKPFREWRSPKIL